MELLFRPIKVGNRVIKARNWKVKDRLMLKEAFKNVESEIKAQEKTLDILVYNCLEEQVPLNENELEYLFAILRVNSIGDDVEFRWTCSNENCNQISKTSLKVSKIYKPKFGELKDIKVNDISIELQEVKNVEYYNKRIRSSSSPSLDDLILHIKTVNGQTMSEDKIQRVFDELDTKDMDAILDKWDEIRFTIDRSNKVKCEHCGKEEEFEFDEIPNMIPQNWLKR